MMVLFFQLLCGFEGSFAAVEAVTRYRHHKQQPGCLTGDVKAPHNLLVIHAEMTVRFVNVQCHLCHFLCRTLHACTRRHISMRNENGSTAAALRYLHVDLAWEVWAYVPNLN
jgi:hypothetical protein